MKKLLMIIVFMTIASYCMAQDVSTDTTGTETSSGTTSTSTYDLYCDPTIKETIENVRKSLATSDADGINKDMTEKGSVMPTEEEQDDPCFSVPDLALEGVGDKVKTKFSEVASGIADTMKGMLDSALGIISNIGGFLSDPLGGIGGAVAGLFDSACQAVVSATTNAAESVISIDSYSSAFNTQPYIADNLDIGNEGISFDDKGTNSLVDGYVNPVNSGIRSSSSDLLSTATDNNGIDNLLDFDF